MPGSKKEAPSLNGLRVLVIDDESDSRDLVSAVLKGCGADVISFGTAIEALAEMERQPLDVLISDIGMPLMDGYALIEKIRQASCRTWGTNPGSCINGLRRSRRPHASPRGRLPEE